MTRLTDDAMGKLNTTVCLGELSKPCGRIVIGIGHFPESYHEINLVARPSGQALETTFLEQRPHGDSGFVLLVPRKAERARAELFQIVLNDPARCKAAFSILGQLEVWRIEHGQPDGESGHPMIESGRPWPPIPVIKKFEIYPRLYTALVPPPLRGGGRLLTEVLHAAN